MNDYANSYNIVSVYIKIKIPMKTIIISKNRNCVMDRVGPLMKKEHWNKNHTLCIDYKTLFIMKKAVWLLNYLIAYTYISINMHLLDLFRFTRNHKKNNS